MSPTPTKTSALRVLAKARQQLPTPRREKRNPDRKWWVRLLVPAAVGVVLLIIAGLDFVYSESANLRSYADQIELTLQSSEREIAKIANDTGFLRRQVYGLGKLSPEDQQQDADRILALSQQEFNLCLYRGDSLVFWTNNRVFLPFGNSPTRLPDVQLRRLQNGHYVVKHEQLELFADQAYELIALVPVKSDYSLSSSYLSNAFTGNANILRL